MEWRERANPFDISTQRRPSRSDITNSLRRVRIGQSGGLTIVTGLTLARRIVGEGRQALLCYGPRGRCTTQNPPVNQISVLRVCITAACGRILEQGEALKRSLYLAIAAIALVAAPRVSHAQLGALKPFQLGIAGGATQPMSDLKNGANMGYNATAALGINLPFIPVGLRVDGAYNQFGEKSGVGAKLHVISATGNVVWRLPSIALSPYLIGGAGLYMVTSTTTGTARLPKTIQSPPRFRSAHPFIIEEPLQGEPMSRPDYADSSAAARAKTSV